MPLFAKFALISFCKHRSLDSKNAVIHMPLLNTSWRSLMGWMYPIGQVKTHAAARCGREIY